MVDGVFFFFILSRVLIGKDKVVRRREEELETKVKEQYNVSGIQ